MKTLKIKHYSGSIKETKMVEVETPTFVDLEVTLPFFRKLGEGGECSWITSLSVWNDGYRDRFVESRIHFDHGRYTICPQESRDQEDVAHDFAEPTYTEATADEFTEWLGLAREQINLRYEQKLGRES